MAKILACMLLALATVVAVESKCCFNLMERWTTDIVAGLVYRDGDIMTETAKYGRDPKLGLQGSSKVFTNVITGAVSTVRKVQRYQAGVSKNFKTWMIYDEKYCTIEMKPSAIQNCVPAFDDLESIWYGNNTEARMDITRKYSLTPAGAVPGDETRLEKTLYVSPGCSLSNSLKIDVSAEKKFASLVNYANFRVVDDEKEYGDMFVLPSFCPTEVMSTKRDELFF
jgi:hypothetical protein